MLNYYMAPVSIAGHTDKFRAVPIYTGSFSEAQMIQELAERNSGLPIPAITAIIKTMFEIRDKRLNEGYTVRLGDLHFRPTIPGSYETKDAEVGGARVASFVSNSDKPLRDVGYHFVRERLNTNKAFIEEVYDVITASSNNELTPNRVVRIEGKRLTFNPADTETGVFFIDVDTAEEFRATVIIMNRPSLLAVEAPNLTSGTQYWLEVRTREDVLDEINIARTGFMLEAQ